GPRAALIPINGPHSNPWREPGDPAATEISIPVSSKRVLYPRSDGPGLEPGTHRLMHWGLHSACKRCILRFEEQRCYRPELPVTEGPYCGACLYCLDSRLR